jgi:hypothetical protein
MCINASFTFYDWSSDFCHLTVLVFITLRRFPLYEKYSSFYFIHNAARPGSGYVQTGLLQFYAGWSVCIDSSPTSASTECRSPTDFPALTIWPPYCKLSVVHWLPIHYRITYKLCTINVRHSSQPVSSLHGWDCHINCAPFNASERSLTLDQPHGTLPEQIRWENNFSAFKKRLETLFFISHSTFPVCSPL